MLSILRLVMMEQSSDLYSDETYFDNNGLLILLLVI